MTNTIVSAEPVYVLRVRVNSGIPRQTHEGQVIFRAGGEAEIAELLEMYGAGKTDERIIEQLPPRMAYERPYLQVETLGLFAPNGRDVWETMKLHAARGANGKGV